MAAPERKLLMATVQKVVRFYDTTLVDENDERVPVDPDFWAEPVDALDGWELPSRRES